VVLFLYFYKKINSGIIKNYLQILFLLLSQFVVSQNDSVVKGIISIETNNNDGITIVNISNKTNTISGNGGYFNIKAKVNDTLIFSAIHLDVIKHIIMEKDFGKDLLFIKMTPKSKTIEQILITSNTVITPENLGLVPKGQKRYTVAERRLYTGTNGIGIGTLMNLITGYRKELKNNVEVEKKEMFQEKILKQFEKEYFTNTLKIPENYISGFLFYISEDKETVELFKSKDKMMHMFKLSELATEYLKTIETEAQKENQLISK
jgi:hypothetical protein